MRGQAISEQRPDGKDEAKPHGYQGLVSANSASEAHACELGGRSEMGNPARGQEK